ncbi:MAG: hypothetical protein IPO59_11380 [Betaproteobacteria bacterium]|nr:hypothetical protein [Betaproteobacteria bacterium]
MSAPVMSEQQAAALALLASSPLAAEAAQRHEQARAEQRRAVLERLQADEVQARAAQPRPARGGPQERATRWRDCTGKPMSLRWHSTPQRLGK